MQANPLAFKAFFATRPNALETLKLFLKDYLDEDDVG